VGKIFINYRRGSDAGFAQALYQHLESEFAVDDLFMDVEGHVHPGEDFVEVLNAQVAACDVFLAVIGPRWTRLLTARKGDPRDFVAIEIEAAIDQEKHVIPVLVDGASMPPTDKLPEKIRPLAGRNAIGLRPERFKADCQSLVAALKEHLAAAEKEIAAVRKKARAGKVVLILGHFRAERMAVIDALREELRKLNYHPILYDFDVPATRDITGTVSQLAHKARFIIADLTDPSSISQELQVIIPLLAVPVQPLLEGGARPYAMFRDYWKYDWVLPVYRYESLDELLTTLADKVIAPAEAKVKALEERRRREFPSG
jgi:hypothetical protein